MDYTICSKVIEAAKEDKSYLSDLLYKFADTTSSNKIVKNNNILEKYNLIAIDDIDIKSWINVMGFNSSKCWKNIDCTDEPIFLKTCLETHDKKLIVSEKEDYSNYEELIPIDKDEAIQEINPSSTTTINQYGDNSQATGGNNSLITNS